MAVSEIEKEVVRSEASEMPDDSNDYGVTNIPIGEIKIGRFDLRLNPNKEAQVKPLVKRIKETGQINPITVAMLPEGDYELIDGHARFSVAKKLGYDEVPAIVIEGEDSAALYRRALHANDTTGLDHVARTKLLVAYLSDLLATNNAWKKMKGSSEEKVLVLAKAWESEAKRNDNAKFDDLETEVGKALHLFFPTMKAISSLTNYVKPILSMEPETIGLLQKERIAPTHYSALASLNKELAELPEGEKVEFARNQSILRLPAGVGLAVIKEKGNSSRVRTFRIPVDDPEQGMEKLTEAVLETMTEMKVGSKEVMEVLARILTEVKSRRTTELEKDDFSVDLQKTDLTETELPRESESKPDERLAVN